MSKISKQRLFKINHPELFEESEFLNSNVDDYTVFIENETDLAIQIEDGIWLPKSQIKIGDRRPFKPTVITVPNWLAEEKELI